jgi:hypothetical protein
MLAEVKEEKRELLTHCEESVSVLWNKLEIGKPKHFKRDTHAWLVRKVVSLLSGHVWNVTRMIEN